MWSAKKILLGSLALGGVAAAGYLAYRYYTRKNSEIIQEEEVEEESHQGENQPNVNKETQDTVTETETLQKVNEEVAGMNSAERDVGEIEEAALDKTEAAVGLEEPAVNQSEAEEFAEAAVDKKEATEDQAQLKERVLVPAVEQLGQPQLLPTPRPSCLEHVKTMKDLEITFEVLAAYLFTQNRSEEELKEAERELGWVWHAAVAFKARLPQNVPLLLTEDDNDEDVLPLQDPLTGMQSVD